MKAPRRTWTRQPAPSWARSRSCISAFRASTPTRIRRDRDSIWSGRCVWPRQNRCWLPGSIDELTASFEHQFKALEERLANDIEEGGRLYDLASTPPFDKAINDLLLNMSIGIG